MNKLLTLVWMLREGHGFEAVESAFKGLCRNRQRYSAVGQNSSNRSETAAQRRHEFRRGRKPTLRVEEDRSRRATAPSRDTVHFGPGPSRTQRESRLLSRRRRCRPLKRALQARNARNAALKRRSTRTPSDSSYFHNRRALFRCRGRHLPLDWVFAIGEFLG